jgi:hypothetical protein
MGTIIDKVSLPANAVLLLVAVIVIFFPALQVLPFKAVMLVTYFVVFGINISQMWRKGWLSMTPGQLANTGAKISSFEFLAQTLGTIALLLVL